jgi:hypothetical protein
MELLINGNALDLSTDFSIEMEELNPFFSEVGAQSLPMQLPFTPHNLSLLGRPERMAHTIKLDNEHEAVIRHGMFQKNGKLVIFSADKENGIDATFYMNDGEFYTKIKDVHLNYINFDNPLYNPDYNPDPFTGTAAEKAAQWMQRFEAVQRGEIQAPYAIFPVCTNVEEKTDDNNNKYNEYELLNEPDIDSTLDDTPCPLLGYEERTIKEVDCPVGYGITPFLYLNFFLRCLFAHFGYHLNESFFDTNPDLSKIVLLNNNADTICSGKLDYRQLLPDCSVTTFLDTLRNKFCCEFIPDGRTKTVTVYFFEHNALKPDMDISPFIVDKPFVAHETFKQIRLSAGASIQFATPAAETMEQILLENLYSSAMNENDFHYVLYPEDGVEYGRYPLAFGEIILRKATGQFYKQSSSNGSSNPIPIGSCFFDYDKKTKGLDYDERTSDDEQVPVALLSIMRDVNEYLTIGYFPVVPIIGTRKHLNTGIKNDDSAEEESAEKTDIMFCFFAGAYNRLFYGTPFCYTNNGEDRGGLSLQYAGEKGLFVHFWKKYDALLRHAFRKITCKLQMPLAEFLKFNIFTPKLLNGVPVLPVSMKYNITHNGVEISEVEFRTLRLQLPYNLETEQEVPQFNTSVYYWIRKTDAETVAHSAPNQEYFLDYRILTSPQKSISDYNPPTEEQYNANERYPEGTFILRVTYTLLDGPLPPPGGSTPFKYIDLEYSSWLEPRKKG